MPIAAYILIDVTPGTSDQVAKELLKISGVKSAHRVTGPHDIIAFVETPDMSMLGRILSSRIHAIPGILRTETDVLVD
jgi:DNA-binding Lrp family transcriptional regulator